MKKFISLSLVSLSLLFASVSFAAVQPNTTPHVEVFKNLPAAAVNLKLTASAASYVPHIALYNDFSTRHTFTINSNGSIVVAYPGDRLDFFYYNFRAGPQAMTIVSDDGTVVFNDYAPDGALLHIVTYEGPNTTTYQVLFE